MNDIDKNLSEILGAEEVEEVEESPPKQEVILSSDHDLIPAETPQERILRDIEYDYEFSRETQRELLDVGSDALEGIMRVAKESQHPRAYEVAANLLKIQSDITDKLMELHNKRKALTGETPMTQHVNVDKAVFVGSTSELLDKIKQDKASE